MSTEGEGEQSHTSKSLIPACGSKVKTRKVKGIYQKMIQIPELKLAYESVSRKSSANTKGVDKETLDGYSEKELITLHEALKDHSFKFKPIRRIHIPKKDGGKRPLGLPSPRDKVVQKAACNVLEKIYEGIFLDCSHGFRPGKSTHTALAKITQ